MKDKSIESTSGNGHCDKGECTSYTFWDVLSAIMILAVLLTGIMILGPCSVVGVDAAELISKCYVVKSKMGNGRFDGSMLVDSGASSHIIIDESRFCYIDKDFKPQNHFVELADGTKHNEFAMKRGHVMISLEDKLGNTVQMKLHDVLFIPTFPTVKRR